ncbi:MAG: ATP-dependent RNA helicase RhlB, partial [Lysobacter sp.]|nr:ATP-dependent RNA helicase RhlB [Lysobacter sp.]
QAQAHAGEGTDTERAPRKRRRRRGGRRLEGADALQAPVATPQAATPGTPAASGSADVRPSLLARIGKGLKSLVTRAPRSQH